MKIVTTNRFASLSFTLVCCLPIGQIQAAGPFQATGFKVGEVTDSTAIVWTRLTRNSERNPSDGPMVKIKRAQSEGQQNVRRAKVIGVEYPDDMTVADIRDAVPGTSGEVRVLYKTSDSDERTTGDWQPVDPQRDFTRQFLLSDLRANTEYLVRVESRAGRGAPAGQSLEGRFRTAPKPDDAVRVVFTVSTGQGYGSQDRPDGYNIYPQMLKLAPSFFVHTGDIVYYDQLAKTIDLARYHWQRTYSLPTNVEFHRQVAAYFIKDDHDTWQNDCWPSMKRDNMFEFTFEQGLAVFPEQVPMGESTYRTRRWGKDLQIWLVEGRDFRSANTDPDGPAKTIWGTKQKEWFKRTVRKSDATFRVLISPTPLVGPDRTNKADNHSNKAFAYEGQELRRFIASQQNMVVVCGDRHWQYMSVDPETGTREYSCGPISDKHAGGWRQSDFVESHHRYLNVIGGFLSVTVDQNDGENDGVPTATFRHHDVQGKVRFEDVLKAAARGTGGR
jgi:alkaline phosphatase D